MQAAYTAQSAPQFSPQCGIHAHRAPDPAPVDDPMPEPFETPHPHHQPVHLPRDEEPVPDPNPS